MGLKQEKKMGKKMNNHTKALTKIARAVEKRIERKGSNHDWWHAKRVSNLCMHIGKKEEADLEILIASAYIHDAFAEEDYKNHITKAVEYAKKLLTETKFPKEKIDAVVYCIENHEHYDWFKERKYLSKEALILQDADRLDAIGAIGIARVFSFGGAMKRAIWTPGEKTDKKWNYQNVINETSSITHFYDKLLKLKDAMNTETAKKMATERHKFMELYLKQFYKEWEAEL